MLFEQEKDAWDIVSLFLGRKNPAYQRKFLGEPAEPLPLTPSGRSQKVQETVSSGIDFAGEVWEDDEESPDVVLGSPGRRRLFGIR